MKHETNFRDKVYRIVREIPCGKTMNYKEIARRIGFPRAWRAVGNVLRKNQNPQISCHRVIRSDGKIGGYKSGIKKKIELLKKEGIKINYGKITSGFTK